MTTKVCSFTGCTGKPKAKGLCSPHYKQKQRGGDLRPIGQKREKAKCTTDGCSTDHYAKGLCRACYDRARGKRTYVRATGKNGDQCSVDGCSKAYRAKGFCKTHYDRARKGAGVTTPIIKRAQPKPKPKQVRSVSKLPAGWDRPMPKRRNAPEASVRELGPVLPIPDEMARAALRTLHAHGADDLAEVLGLEAA